MNLKRYCISNLFFYLLLFGFLFIVQHIQLLSNDPFQYLTTSQIIVSSLIFICISVCLFLFEKKQCGYKPNYKLLIVLSILFVTMLIVTLIWPENASISVSTGDGKQSLVSLQTNYETKFLFIVVNFFSLLIAYIILDLLPKKIRCSKQLNFIFLLIIIVTLVSIIFSICTEIDKYVEFFSGSQISNENQIKSFTNHPNNFGTLILLGIISCLFIHHCNKKFYWYILAVIFFLFLPFTASRTNLLCAFIILSLYLIFRCILSYKKHIKRNSITLGVLFLIFIAFLSIYLFSHITGTQIFIVTKIDDVFNSIMSKSDLTGRIYIWETVIQFLNQGYWVCGLGFGLFSGVMYQSFTQIQGPSWQCDSAHNGLFQILGSGGIILLVLFLAAIVYLVYAMVKIFKKHKTLVFLSISVLLCIFTHMIFEGSTPLIASTPVFEYLVFSIIVFVPVLSTYFNEKNSIINKDFKAEYIDKKRFEKVKEKFIVSKSLLFFLTPICAVFAAFSCIYTEIFIFRFASIFAFVLLLILPCVAVQLGKNKANFADFFKTVFLPYLVVIAFYLSFSILVPLFIEKSVTMTAILTVLPLFLYFSLFLVIPSLSHNSGVVGIAISKLNNISAHYIASGIKD